MFGDDPRVITADTGAVLLEWLATGVKQKDFADYLAAIDGAQTMAALKAEFIAAHHFAGSDAEMLSQFEQAKDQRKEQLTTPTQEAA